MAAVHDICRFRRVPKVQPAEDKQTMTHVRLTISLVGLLSIHFRQFVTELWLFIKHPFLSINPSHAVHDISCARQYPPWLLFTTFVVSVGYPRYNPQKTGARLMISLVVRVISRSKNNFYDVIRLKLIESRYFLKETVKVGLEKSKQNSGQLKAAKLR